MFGISHPDNPQPETYFNIKKLGQQIAIGTGFGFRYDVQFFVFRFDLGLKLKDPQFVGSEQWVIGKFLRGAKDFKTLYEAVIHQIPIALCNIILVSGCLFSRVIVHSR
jgi:outer membrane protein insertion porin family